MNGESGRGARRAVVTAGKSLVALFFALLVVDGVLSVVRGARWLEFQRDYAPSSYSRFVSAFLRLPDSALRVIGAAQAAASAALLLRIK